ncbi:MAG TPA: thiamine pyrophosphate-dependent enzyme [Candidatus Limnocylindria bacterium]|nr:thiamine pyrophosphate-dependent enzyme [Candidatus Limnocylindria bacterium]
MRRSAAAALFAKHLAPDDVVVCGLGSTRRAWSEVGAPQLTYNASDPMGTAPALALGLALACPDRRIVLLEGDGDLTMNLGVLVTIAGAAPANLRLAVFVNDRYETGGGQPLPNAGRVSYVTVAGGAGWPWTGEAHDEQQAERLMPALLDRPGLGLLALHVEPEASPYPADPGPTTQYEDRAIFQRRLLGER